MKKLLGAALVTAMVGGASAVGLPSASAHTSLCVGTGSANTPNLGYPGLHAPVTGGFAFNLSTAGGCVSGDGLSNLTAGGTLTGNCGLSYSLSATLTDGGGTHDFNYTSVGSLLVLSASVGAGATVGTSGTTTETEVNAGASITVGVANAVPLPGAPGTPNANSCASGNANTFQVTGVVLNA